MESITKYFNAEKYESLLFIAVGIIAIILSAYFIIKLKTPFHNGASWSLIAIALIQLTVGTIVYLRSPKDIVRVNEIILTDRTKIQSEEIPRMNVAMKNFVLYRWVEIVLMLIGIVVFFYFPPMTFWKGLGLGLFIQSTLMLTLDFFAESRGKTYLEFLQNLN